MSKEDILVDCRCCVCPYCEGYVKQTRKNGAWVCSHCKRTWMDAPDIKKQNDMNKKEK